MIAGIAVVVTLALLGAVAYAIDTPEPGQRAAYSDSLYAASAALTATLEPVRLPAWTIGQAGLVGPAAWLTAPRETQEFAVRRAAIHAAYEAADLPVAAVLAAAGWPTGG